MQKEYDIITLHRLLYGIPNPVKIFQDLFKILKDDGILYVNTPNSDSFAMDFYKGKANHLYGYTTQNVFNKKSLTVLAELTGYEIVSFRTEWFDIYVTDMIQFYNNKDKFIHKIKTLMLKIMKQNFNKKMSCKKNWILISEIKAIILLRF